ncbi:MAG: S8 family serine peptidase [Sphingomonas sp.]
MFDAAAIEAALNGGAALAHRDCIGHGTHVAATAAGGVIFPSGGDARLVGVAPEADIIAVKALDVPRRIDYFTGPAQFGGGRRPALRGRRDLLPAHPRGRCRGPS